jgi:predicted small lipoprotein YifL
MRLATVTQASVLAAGMALMLAACGQKGALYLPDKSAAIVTPPPGAPAAPAQSAAPQPQAAPSQPPQATPATPKKTDKDGESQPPQ